MFLQSSCFLHPKILPKTPPKRGPESEKIDAENVLFFNIDFFTFWAPFWEGLGSQDGAKMGQNGGQKLLRTLPGALLKATCFQRRVLERSGLDFGALGLDFGGPGPRFWRVWGSKWAPSKWQAAKNAEICQELAETWQLSAKVFLDGGMGEPRVAKKGGAAVDPPWGFSMELAILASTKLRWLPFLTFLN